MPWVGVPSGKPKYQYLTNWGCDSTINFHSHQSKGTHLESQGEGYDWTVGAHCFTIHVLFKLQNKRVHRHCLRTVLLINITRSLWWHITRGGRSLQNFLKNVECLGEKMSYDIDINVLISACSPESKYWWVHNVSTAKNNQTKSYHVFWVFNQEGGCAACWNVLEYKYEAAENT